MLRSALTATALLAAMPAAAQEKPGAFEYLRSCAVCHGEDGTGNPVAASMLVVEPPDLTRIAERNCGSFPFGHIVRIIDGRGDVRGHGPMPIWGYEFQNEDLAVAGHDTAELLVRGRILSLAMYLEEIQQ